MEYYVAIKMTGDEYVRPTIKYLCHIVTRKEKQIKNNYIEYKPYLLHGKICLGKRNWEVYAPKYS